MTSYVWNLSGGGKNIKLTVISKTPTTLTANGDYFVLSDRPIDNNKVKANIYFQDSKKWFDKNFQEPGLTMDLVKLKATVNSQIQRSYTIQRTQIDGGYVFNLVLMTNPFVEPPVRFIEDVPETLTNEDKMKEKQKLIDETNKKISALQEVIRKAEADIKNLRPKGLFQRIFDDF
jgi:hypothetical protein